MADDLRDLGDGLVDLGDGLVDLGDGLVLRRGRPDDADALAAFNADVLRPQDAAEPDAGLGAWTRDLMTGRHPTFTPDSTLVVEHRPTGDIVASAMLLSQVLSFAGVTMTAGQPELVGTRADHRGRGLVRAMFDTLHAWSAERGHVMQLISGIPWFYRQFGYELAIERGGGPVLGVDRLPGTQDAGDWRVRPLTLGDVPFAAALDADVTRQRYLVSVPRDESLWRYEATGHSEGSVLRQEWRIIEAPGGRAVAVLSHQPRLHGSAFVLTGFEVDAGVSWRAVWNAAVPYLRATGEEWARRDGKASFTSLGFWWLGREHPLYRVVHFTDFRRPGAVYVRVPDVARFLALVAPVLTQRVAESPMAGHTGELRLSFYRDGVRLALAGGAVTRVERWRPPLSLLGQEMGRPSRDPGRPDAGFPGLTFLQLLFGARSFDDLERTFPDCFARTGETRALLAALFPTQPSDVWPVL
jgi:hypothetical protein